MIVHNSNVITWVQDVENILVYIESEKFTQKYLQGLSIILGLLNSMIHNKVVQ